MTPKLNPHVANLQKVCYAKEEAIFLPVDCADGCNPYGCSDVVLNEIEKLRSQDVFEYPHGFELKDAIIRYWEGQAKLDRSMIYLANGSIEAIALTNTIFAREGAKFVGVWPQFTDYISNARGNGLTYVPVMLRQEENYKIIPERIIEVLDNDVSLIYLDNPNNPTGQNIPLQDLRRILEAAKVRNICVVADEAYGDSLPMEESAMNLINEFDNLIFIKTLSKGMGLAGMRAGYLVATPEIVASITKIGTPYCISGLSRKMAVAAMSDKSFIENSRQKTKDIKLRVMACTGNKLHMAETLDTCSICFLYHDDPNYDLSAAFTQFGVKTVAGNDFEGMGINTVRLRMPSAQGEEALLQAVKAINQG